MGPVPGGRDDGNVASGLTPGLAAVLGARGEMNARIRDFDWEHSALGAVPARWPASLQHAVATMLSSRMRIVMFWGPDLVTLYNDAYSSGMGIKHPGSLGLPGHEVWPEIWDVLGPLLTGVVESGDSYSGIDHPFLLERHGYPEETYFDISYDPVWTDEGRVGGVFCIVNETTGRVLGARRLSALAQLGSDLAGVTTSGELGRRAVEILDRHQADVPFSFCYLDEGSGCRLVGVGGVPHGEVVGWSDHSPPAPPEEVARVLAGGPGITVAVSHLLRHPVPEAGPQALVLPLVAARQTVGALVVGVSRRLPLTDDYRNFFRLVAAQISGALVTLRAYEFERARAAELAAIDQAKSNFFANVSHEFRTPLTLVLGPLEDALADPSLPTGHLQTLAMVHRNARRLLKLVNTLLDFARLQAGRVEASYQSTDLSDYTAGLVSTFRSAAQRSGIELVVECDPLPEPVYVDREMWEKVVLNLLSNALKFTFEGTVTVRLAATDGVVRLEVADTGVGIPADELDRVFDRFHRGSGGRARADEGTGIGLALVRELTELHGGTVGVTSRLGSGSVFTVTLPSGRGHLPAARVVEQAGPAAVGSRVAEDVEEAIWWSGNALTAGSGAAAGEPGRRRGTGGGPDDDRPGLAGRVLVVDDNPDLREHLRALLAPYWSVVAVADGESAYAAAVSEPFDLVLTDLMMPRLDGSGLVRRLRADQRTRHVPIVILSARAGPAETVDGLSAGADDYLVKPFSAQELIARVRTNIDLGQLRSRIIRQLRALADAAVGINSARTTPQVLEAAARHALSLARAGRVLASAAGGRYEVDGGGRLPTDAPVVIPLVSTAEETLGELKIWPRAGRPTGPDVASGPDGAALAQLARLVGARLENARLYEAEHRIATTLQHSLLPRTLPQLPGALIATRYLPGNTDVEVGGDWYDVIAIEDGCLVLTIGDVVGKGVPAAAAMGQLRNALRAYVLEGLEPGTVLTRLNQLVVQTDRRSSATMVLLRFDPATGVLAYASAGHPPPLILDGDDATPLHDRALGPPIGALPGSSYRTAPGQLRRGQRLLLYTDGLIEDRDQGIDVGLDALRSAAGSSFDHVEDLVEAMVERVTDRRRRDDIAILALEAAEPDRFFLRVPADPTKLSLVRKRLETFLGAHGVGETDLFDITVAVSEAAANAIEHPLDRLEPVITVEVTIVDGEVTATVRDTGRWREAREPGFRGRGLALIGALGELTVQRTAGGTAVTLRRRLGGDDPTGSH